jgi:hypothetical protein
MIYKPTRREFLKYAGVAATAFGVPMLLKVRPAFALATRGVGPTYISVAATQTNNNTLVGTTIGRSLVAVIMWYDPASPSIFPVISVSGESDMTNIAGSLLTNGGGNTISGQIYYLANNTAGGTKTITIDLGVSGYAEVAVMEYTGLNTSSQPDSSANNKGFTGDPSLILTTINANALIVACETNNYSPATPGSAYTAFGGAGFTSGNLGFQIAMDNVNAGAAGAKTVDLTGIGVGPTWAMTAASFKIAGGGAIPVRHGVISQ